MKNADTKATLVRMMDCGLIELRFLLHHGKTEQAEALTEALRTVSAYMLKQDPEELAHIVGEFTHYCNSFDERLFDYAEYFERLPQRAA